MPKGREPGRSGGTRPAKGKRSLRVAGVFAGIGGIELGLERAGHRTRLLCEVDPGARAVLEARFPGVPIIEDILDLDELPRGIDMVTAGFPCQDLSQAGQTDGIRGRKSSVVDRVFTLLEKRPVEWVLIENVPFMLHLHQGAGIRYLVRRLENLGYRWAYRVIDTRAFGIPQRRLRVYLLASRRGDPAPLLLYDDVGPPPEKDHKGRACGFYWTEGNRGLGWAVDAVPTLKGGSGVGIPSPPAIWMPDGRILTPDIRDAERLQGFRADWTKPAQNGRSSRVRWRLVGNSVTPSVARWLGQVVNRPAQRAPRVVRALSHRSRWPNAAWGSVEGRYVADVSSWPVSRKAPALTEYLKHDPELLSQRAAAGFLKRLEASSLRYPSTFRADLERHVRRGNVR